MNRHHIFDERNPIISLCFAQVILSIRCTMLLTRGQATPAEVLGLSFHDALRQITRA